MPATQSFRLETELKANSSTDTFLHPKVQKRDLGGALAAGSRDGRFPSVKTPGLTPAALSGARVHWHVSFLGLSPPFCKRGQFLFGPVFAVLLRSHPIMSTKLAVEVCQIRKAAFIRGFCDRFVTLLQESASVAQAKVQ
jgi:hypothetical protein